MNVENGSLRGLAKSNSVSWERERDQVSVPLRLNIKLYRHQVCPSREQVLVWVYASDGRQLEQAQ